MWSHERKEKKISHCWSSESLNSSQQSPTALCYEYSAWVNFRPEEIEEALLYTAARKGLPLCRKQSS